LHQSSQSGNQNLLVRPRNAFHSTKFLDAARGSSTKNNCNLELPQKFSLSEEKLKRMLSNLPFTLTNAQNKVLGEFMGDLDSWQYL